jgi:hypothetical protein
VACTSDTCDEVADSCDNTPDNTACADTAFCNGVETCDPANGDPVTGCLAGSSPCDDTISCTVDNCNEGTDTCSNVANNSLCNDGLFCTGTEICNVQNGGCESINPPSCADTFGCTTDYCDPNTDSCAHVAVNSNCDNSTFCDGQETCSPTSPTANPATGCMVGTPVACGDGIPCTVDSCNEAAQACDHVPNNGACDNGLFCDGVETCSAGQGCLAGNAVVCNDGLSCTGEVCSEAVQGCVVTVNNTICDDGLFCNGGESCDPNAPPPGTGCVAGTNFACNPDAFSCTDETCDEVMMGCISTPNSANCPAGQLCLPGTLGSDPVSGCKPASACTTNGECDDMNDCNGVETCDTMQGICVAGTPVNCNDGIVCTIDSCNPNGGTCTNMPNSNQCDDGLVCNGVEVCDPMNGDPNTGCIAGTPVVCDDSFSCTFDQCTEPGGVCVNFEQNNLCDDGLFCTGQEICDPSDPMANMMSGCILGTAPSCDDGVACTTDSCNSNFDACDNLPDNSLCPNCGDTCDPVLGCGNFCVISECGGKVYECGDCQDNDGDCGIDTGGDSECLGPCDNNEEGYKGEIPGQNAAPCKQDCYFDGDTGAGNDDCYWNHECDPFEVAPNYDPEGMQCAYDPNANTPGTNQSCSQLQAAQSNTCLNYCGPLTPNGCDCFGCCDVPSAPTPIWLGSTDSNGNASCTSADLADPTKCKPCTIVQGCFNDCANCEICLGKPTLPPECLCQECPPNVQLCGPPCGTPCPGGSFCNNGCCVLNPG